MKNLWKVLVGMAVMLALVVIPAVALAANPSGPVVLTTNVSVMCITVTPGAADFGNLAPGGPCSGDTANPLSVANCGSTPITVTATVTGDSLYTDNLQLYAPATGWVYWYNGWTITIPAGNTVTVYVKLCVPASYLGSGIATGSLSFLAAP